MGGLFGQLFTKLTLPPASAVDGKTILITGGNTGLGREAARHALALGAATVILGVRTLSKGEEAKADIESSTGNSGRNKVLVWPIDLESFASVQAFAERARNYVAGENGRLDLAIMNAGIASVMWAVTPDGWERHLQINVLSTALLSLKLLPLLRHTAEQHPQDWQRPHLVIVTSDSHESVKFPERTADRIFPVLNDQGQWAKSQRLGGPIERYGVSKLMAILMTEDIARLVPRSTQGDPLVVVNSVAPGFCKSELLTRESVPWFLKVIEALVARSAQEGSKTLLDSATRGIASHGKWLENQAITTPGKLVTDPNEAAYKKKEARHSQSTSEHS
ncbi:hypothetical protein AN8585.2 [Aspergillus nidulans FGSC A4]|uniref:Short-chain dehydrogenase, putative (AFU_orthologue AFUA_4G00160) n=1 Tax=Emericella nidulans (strain FGSC A4 / ATCC 38163 / CBS 112.46 / NRRL 194 / M139) TaxID=227321 RepID=Q5ASZ5_EMENI|nr:hypothetical protein [Aspergillus nidulans FGSC A4]EAA60619.1 hypothetical protein AN8585.2 [Aspergillus nidulans FGSC A4]CBF78390.1 TPA: short-chain dehydrogenase, putative (AFU_orthologue; AFUA_4G00160) [Aspergillus nidulans FGSC A4]|eukprot:XP_681854.1 hypothetical protein AN8585.2 [Aspergillus nidulans FGSC A4]